MLNFIKLEFKKNKFRGNWLGILIANLAIMGLVALMYFDPEEMEEAMTAVRYADIFGFIDTLARATFIVYAAVLIAKFVIEEYKNKTMSLMFSYPINRKKLIAAKLIIVFVWTILAIILTNIVVGGAFLIADHFAGRITDTLESGMILTQFLKVLLNAVAAAGLALISLFFGMWKKSVPATIVSAVCIVSVINSSTGGFSLYSIIAIPLLLAAVGIVIAYLAIRNIDKVDLV